MPLPNDVLYIILGLLRDEEDYSTLYQCALSSKFFAEHSLMLLYQIHDTVPVTGGGSAEDESIKARRMGYSAAIAKRQQEKTIRKWSTMWRSLVQSALDKTYLPYCAYIRYLNLADLLDMLSLPNFVGASNVHFFTPEIRKFVREAAPQGEKGMPSNCGWYANTFGKLIIQKTTSIRGVRTDNSSDKLVSEVLSEMPLLESLSVWQGSALKNTGEIIHKYCPEFKRLTVYLWANMVFNVHDVNDSEAEKFLTDLRPNTLESFETVSYSSLREGSIKGLGSHLNSLEVLNLSSLNADTVRSLVSLPALPRLKKLILTDSKPFPKDEAYTALSRQFGEWIYSCKSLRLLNLRVFVDDIFFLLSHALREDGPRLTTLDFSCLSTVAGIDSFYEALATQGTLQNFRVTGDCFEEPEYIGGMVQALVHLKNLRALDLYGVSDGFTPDHIMALMPFLPRLEHLAVGGDHFDDTIWKAFLCLPKFKSLTINALSDFTAQGILDFIAQLGPGNTGFNLSIMSSTNDANLTDEEQKLINDTLENSLGGVFEFCLAQDEYSDIESDEYSD